MILSIISMHQSPNPNRSSSFLSLAAAHSACEYARDIATDLFGLNPDWASGSSLCCSNHSNKESLTTVSKILLSAGKIEIGLYDPGDQGSFLSPLYCILHLIFVPARKL